MNTSLDTGRPLCVSGAIVDWNLSIDLLLQRGKFSTKGTKEVCTSIQIH